MPSSAAPRARIVCLEGPSAVGKTSLAAALVRAMGAAVVPELDAAEAPPPAESASWFLKRHEARWQEAEALATTASLVVLDGDPFKGLWYDWSYAMAGGPRREALVAPHRDFVARGTLAFPDLYVVLQASEAQLRARRATDPRRTRRNFEAHLRLAEPQRRHFVALKTYDPSRVCIMDTGDREALPAAVQEALARLSPGTPDAPGMLAHLTAYLCTPECTEALPGTRIDAPAG